MKKTFKDYLRERTSQLQDKLPITNSKILPGVASALSGKFYTNDGDPRGKNASWWLFQIEAMLNAFMDKPNGRDEELVSIANEYITNSGYTAQKFLITRKNLISNLFYVKDDLIKMGVNPNFSNVNSFSAAKVDQDKAASKKEKNKITASKMKSSLSDDELAEMYNFVKATSAVGKIPSYYSSIILSIVKKIR